MKAASEPRRLRAIIETQNEIASTRLSLDAVMQRVCDRARELTEAAASVVELAENDEMVYRAVAGTARPFLGLRLLRDASLSGLCVRLGEVLRCDDAASDDRVDEDACRKVGAMSMICVPLRYEAETVGVLKVYASQPNYFDDDDVETLDLLSGLIAAHLSHASRLETALDEGRRDGLTGLGNRRAYDEALAREASRAVRYGSTLTLALFDVDGFKAVNDHHGHPRGDELLIEVGRILSSARTSDQAFRIGGDEFALILPETDHPGGRLVATRIADQVMRSRRVKGDATVSIGVAQARSLDPRVLHAEADAALYEAKRSKR